MPLFSDTALTLRHFDFGEADRIVSFFCRRRGKIRVVAKSARRLKSRFSGRLEPFHSVGIVYFGKENATLFKLSSVDMNKARSGISENLDKFTHACYLTEVIENGLKEHDPNPAAFDAAVSAFGLINSEPSRQQLDLIIRFFDLKFLGSIGYRPTFDACVYCKKPLPEGACAPLLPADRQFYDKSSQDAPSSLFSVEKGGLLCNACKPGRGKLVPLSAGSAKFLAKMTSMSFDKINRLKPSPALFSEISASVVAFRNSKLQSVINSERFFTSVTAEK